MATVSVDAPDSHKAADREALSGSIMSALFARAPRQPPEDASPQPQRQTQELTQAQTLAHQQMIAQQHQSRSDGRAAGPPPGLGGIAPPAPAAAGAGRALMLGDLLPRTSRPQGGGGKTQRYGTEMKGGRRQRLYMATL